MPVFSNKAILDRPETIAYIGSEKIYEGLLANHPKDFTPFGRTPTGKLTFHVNTIDTALAIAKAAGTFLEEPKPSKRKPPHQQTA